MVIPPLQGGIKDGGFFVFSLLKISETYQRVVSSCPVFQKTLNHLTYIPYLYIGHPLWIYMTQPRDDPEADEQSRRMAIAESGIHRSMKQHKEAQKKGADLFDRFAKIIAERDE